jgi:hypothetical protein
MLQADQVEPDIVRQLILLQDDPKWLIHRINQANEKREKENQ